MSAPLRLMRANRGVVALGTPRFYQRRGAITSEIVVTPGDPEISDAVPRVTGITPFRVLFPIGAVLFVAFWTWALFFSSKEALNKIDDRAWAARAEQICEPVKTELRRMELLASPDLDVRSDLIIQSTDMLAAMLDDVSAVQPTDAKGQAIVPDWLADYRTLLSDRYAYAERLRAGQDGPFTETAVRGVPITERIETFAGDNEMPSCAPPRGSIV